VSNDYGRTFQQAVDGMKHSGNCFTVVVDPEDSNVLWRDCNGRRTRETCVGARTADARGRLSASPRAGCRLDRLSTLSLTQQVRQTAASST
jgi:hypothetical protein